ncbi:TonB-dependent receptor [Caulobacter sp. RHG1]|uniref:TonB-dependent receptor n=1 Tax=Caulobacter sp. (strain RHG1) TaxID=2545762 RepID=UPI0019D55C98|nr:TonB-dependent receptor [Caulobacter sp. RHG1]
MKPRYLTTSAIALVLACAAASAQATEPGRVEAFAGDEKVSEVVITGLRSANKAAIDTKRQATNIIDAVSADDVRALPDGTVVEALKRIPGVAVFPSNDNEHTQDESITPALRGLGPAYNNVTIDGLAVASPGTPNGVIGNIARGVRLDILPTSMISQLQVVKTFTADLDPNAVGGAINIVTRSAFEDGGARFLTMDGALGFSSDVGKPHKQDRPGYRLNATGSTTFGPDDKFGFTLSGNYETLSSYTEQHATFDTGFYNFYDDKGQRITGSGQGNGVAVPNQDRYWFNPTTRKRWGLTGKLEFQPSETLEAYVLGGYYNFKTHYERNEVELSLAPNSQATVLDQTATTGRYATGGVRIGYIDDRIDQTTKVVQAGATWRPAPGHVVTLRGSASRATYDERYPMFKYTTGVTRRAPGVSGTSQVGVTDFAFGYDTSNFDFRYILPVAAYNNLSNYSLQYYRPFVARNADDTLYTARVDYAFNRDRDDRGFGFGAGVSYSDDSAAYGVERAEFGPNTTAGPLLLSEGVGSFGPALRYTDGLRLIMIDPVKALAQMAAQPSSAFNETNQTSFNEQDDFTHQERTVGAYALASYRTDTFSLEGGVHLDDTKQSTVGKVRVSGVFRDAPASSSYDFVLPSAIGVWHVTPSLDLRVGASQTIGRPSYDTLASRSAITFVDAIDEGNPNAQGVTVSVGNPNLKPRLSTNYDLSLEWSPSRKYGGIVALAVFKKDIEDEIFTSTTVGYAYQGVTYANARVSQPLNASGASVKGVEVNAILNSLGFVHSALKDFGVSANAAIYKGKLVVPFGAGQSRTIGNLVNQPDDTQNASLFYARKQLELRAAWNRQGRSLRAIQSDVYWQDLYWAPRSQLDLSGSYHFDNGPTVFVQASNITKSRTVSTTGPGKDLLRNNFTVPMTLWVGMRFTPRFR